MGFTLCTCRTIEWESEVRRRETLFNFQFMNVFGFFFHSMMMHRRCMTPAIIPSSFPFIDAARLLCANFVECNVNYTTRDGMGWKLIFVCNKSRRSQTKRDTLQMNADGRIEQTEFIVNEFMREIEYQFQSSRTGLLCEGSGAPKSASKSMHGDKRQEPFVIILIISVAVDAWKVSGIRAYNLPQMGLQQIVSMQCFSDQILSLRITQIALNCHSLLCTCAIEWLDAPYWSENIEIQSRTSNRS